MPFLAAGAAIGAVGGIAGGVMQSQAAGKAAGAAAAADRAALAQQAAMWGYSQQEAAPFVQAGQAATGQLRGQQGYFGNYQSPYMAQAASYVPSLPNLPGAPSFSYAPAAPALPSAPPQMTQADLEATPGYQFTRNQGLLAVQNAAAAKGLGVSGAALKGAADYATGLADNTYQAQFNIAQQRWDDQVKAALAGFDTSNTAWQNNLSAQQQTFANRLNTAQAGFQNQQSLLSNILNLNTADQAQIQANYNRLYNIAALGQNAAAQAGTQTQQASSSMANTTAAMGQAQAAGIMGQANALAGGFTNATNSIGNALTGYYAMNNLFGNGSSNYKNPNANAKWDQVA